VLVKFPVLIHREFGCKPLIFRSEAAAIFGKW
jgi:hypothetical protein